MRRLQSQVVYRNVDCLVELDDDQHQQQQQKVLLEELVDEEPDDLNLILRYLQAQRKVLLYDADVGDNSKRLLKFTASSSQTVQCEPVNEIEMAYFRLKHMERRLETQIGRMSGQCEQFNQQIRSLLLKQEEKSNNSNNKHSAIKLLRKRKLVEKSIAQNEATLNNMQTMIEQIQQADTNRMAFDLYEQSVSALKEVHKDMRVDKIDDTMCDLQDMISTNKEIGEQLASPLSPQSAESDKEFENELENLLLNNDNEDLKNREIEKPASASNGGAGDSSFDMSKMLDSLPQVPTNSLKPTSISISKNLEQELN